MVQPCLWRGKEMCLSERSPLTRWVLGDSSVAFSWLDKAHLAALKMPYFLKSHSSEFQSLYLMSCLDEDSCHFSSKLQQGSGARIVSAPVLKWGCAPNPDEVPGDICPAMRLLPLVSTAHTPDNSFMGFVSEELNKTERQFIKSNKVSSMAVVYGKEASIWKVGVLSAAGGSQAGRGSHRQSCGLAAASGSYPELLRRRRGCVCREVSVSRS